MLRSLLAVAILSSAVVAGSSSARASDKPQDTLAQLLLGQELFRHAKMNRDALMAMTAANLLSQVTTRAAKGDLAKGHFSAVADALPLPAAITFVDALTLARQLAEKRPQLAELVADIESTAMRGVVEGPQEAEDFVPGHGERSYVAIYRSNEPAFFAVRLHRSAKVSLQIFDEYDAPVCADPTLAQESDGKLMQCEWMPTWKGSFHIVLRNAGSQDANIRIMTN